MLTFVSGWRSQDRDTAIFKNRDANRHAIFFIDNQSTLPELAPDAPLIDVWRHGRIEFSIGTDQTTFVRVNYDTDDDMILRSVTHSLLSGADSQIIVTYDALNALYRIFPALRAAGALLAADERLEAPIGDRVIFTRGGSFAWRDHLIEAQTALLAAEETFDAGIVADPDAFEYEDYLDNEEHPNYPNRMQNEGNSKRDYTPQPQVQQERHS